MKHNYPIRNRLLVYLGVATVMAAAFLPTAIVSFPLIATWYRAARQSEDAARLSVAAHRENAEYERALKSFMP